MEPICYIVGACQPGELCLAPGRPAFVIAADQGDRKSTRLNSSHRT